MTQQAVKVSRKSESDKSEGKKEREQAVWASSNQSRAYNMHRVCTGSLRGELS